MEIINRVVQELKKGKVIICPTDTVYGLIADATNKKAVEKIFKIKKRQKNKFLPLFVRDLKAAKEITEINKEQEKFLKKAWPGKVTAVLKLKTKNQKLKIYGVARATIALRIPKHKLILKFLQKLNRPLTGTSANISGKPSSTKIKEVLKQFTLRRGASTELSRMSSEQEKWQPDLVISAGNLPKSRPSTVIDLTISPYKILRQ